MEQLSVKIAVALLTLFFCSKAFGAEIISLLEISF
jgi:hypothetical protein